VAKAITYNNAGVVEAIKRNSGSTKFYPASFQGIIQALDDWEGGVSGGGTSVLSAGGNLPNTNNTEGDLVVIPNGNGDYFMYVFANGAWERLHITTEEVETAGSSPFTIELPDGRVLKNQADINAYLDERITALSEKGYDDTGIKAELEQEATDRTEGDQALQDQIDALEAYDDTDIKADLAQEILDREAGDQELHDKIDALHPPELPDPQLVKRYYKVDRDSINSGSLYTNDLGSSSLTKILVHKEDLLMQAAPSCTVGDQIQLDSEGEQSYLYEINSAKLSSDGTYTEYGVSPVDVDPEPLVARAPYVVTFYVYPANLTNRILEGEQKQSEIIDTVQSALAIQEDIVERVEELQVQQDLFDADQARQDTAIAGEAAINQTQSDQINLLETQIQLLAQAQVVGRWNYVSNISSGSVRPPASKTFYATHQDGAEVVLRDWADARLLMISKTDATDAVYTFTNFEEGDKIEILASDGSSACYGTVTNQPTQEAYGNLIIAVERSSSGPREDKNYILSVYRPGAVSGDVDLETLDGRYAKKIGDTFTGRITTDRPSGEAIRIQKDGETTLQIWTGGNIETQKTTFNNKDLISKLAADGMIKGQLQSYLPLSGGTITDQLRFNKGNKAADQFKIIPNSSDSHTNIYTTGGGQLRFRTSHTDNHANNEGSHIVLDPNNGDPQTKIYNVVQVGNSGAVPKSYVDALVEEKVAEAINDLLSGGLPDPPPGQPSPPPVVKPAFLSWIYDGEKTSAESPATGRFNRHIASTGNKYMRFSYDTNNGIGLGDGKFSDTNKSWDSYGPMMSIWEWVTMNNQNKFKLKRVFYCETLRWNYVPSGSTTAHFEVRVSDGYNIGHGWQYLEEGEEYFVTMGGIF